MCIVYLLAIAIVLAFVSGAMELFGEKVTLKIIGALVLFWLISSFGYIVIPIVIPVAIISLIVLRKGAKKTGFWYFIYKGVPSTNKKDTEMILNEIININSPVIIDTNIWMDEDLVGFWTDLYNQCSTKHIQIVVPSSAYDEILRLKKESFDKIKRLRAQIAFVRIKLFSDCGLLNIHNIKKVRNPYAYADPDIINLCMYICDQKNGSCSLITNDKDLIVRTRHVLGINVEEEMKCRILSVVPTFYAKKRRYIGWVVGCPSL